MSRSGYSEDCDDQWAHIRWRGQVASATKGKRGQKLLTELADALDSMAVKELITNSLKDENGNFCTLGVLGAKRGLDMSGIDPERSEVVADAFDIAEPLAREIVFENDENTHYMTPSERWEYMRKWVQRKIKDTNQVKP